LSCQPTAGCTPTLRDSPRSPRARAYRYVQFPHSPRASRVATPLTGKQPRAPAHRPSPAPSHRPSMLPRRRFATQARLFSHHANSPTAPSPLSNDRSPPRQVSPFPLAASGPSARASTQGTTAPSGPGDRPPPSSERSDPRDHPGERDEPRRDRPPHRTRQGSHVPLHVGQERPLTEDPRPARHPPRDVDRLLPTLR